ncbi:MAG: 2-succinyl-5-enolpyruvyl-6-hydroxy-3-cyclohexene-1-carboxylic-acid synthase [Ferrimicrobium sp.]
MTPQNTPQSATNESVARRLLLQLYALGVTHALVSPGSRSTPLAFALGEGPIFTTVCLDERAAGFAALGIAAASARPVLVVTTSGTAAAELRPAVTEAFYAGVPLIIVTADRPLRLQGVGAPQTIAQLPIFSGVVTETLQLEVMAQTAAATIDSLALQLVALAIASPRGPLPVHLNLHFEEPLLSDRLDVYESVPLRRMIAPVSVGRGLAQPDTRARWVRGSGWIIAGANAGITPDTADALAETLNWPLIADPRSLVHGSAGNLVRYADLILRHHELRDLVVPERLIRFGVPPASRVVSDTVAHWCRGGSELVTVPPTSWMLDPERVATEVAWVDPEATARAIVAEYPSRDMEEPPLLVVCDRHLDGYLERRLSAVPDTEVATVRRLYHLLGPTDQLVVSSSMPLRYLEWFGGRPTAPTPVWANRGANGIDGVVATYLGSALGSPNRFTTLLIGDLAFLYDLTALIHLGHPRSGLIVVLDNDGGSIFDFVGHASLIPSATHEQLFATPHGRDLVADCRGLGFDAMTIESAMDLDEVVAEAREHFRIVVLRTDRDRSRTLLGELVGDVGVELRSFVVDYLGR